MLVMKLFPVAVLSVVVSASFNQPLARSVPASERIRRQIPAQTDTTQIRLTPYYRQRELQASPAIRSRLTDLRANIKTQNLTFEVGYTTAADRNIEELANTVAPTNLEQEVSSTNSNATILMAEENQARSAALSRSAVLPELVVKKKCIAGLRKFDWRDLGKVTPVRNQRCGNCWAYSTLGAWEGSNLIRNNATADASEQYLVNAKTAGTCKGGWWAFDLMRKPTGTGTATEAAVPDQGIDGTNPSGVATPYRVANWGYVSANGGIPTPAEIKQAMCEHGPVTAAVRATSAFQHYTGGIFNEQDPGKVNHGVTIVGWDDDKQAWLIKNSWSTNWGEKGYMWIAYNSNKIGLGAAWVDAATNFYTINPAAFERIRIIPRVMP
jgi:C1A family cysteine protease